MIVPRWNTWQKTALCLALIVITGLALTLLMRRDRQTKPTTYTREELRQAVLGLPLDEVRKKLGAPDSIETPTSNFGPPDPGNEGYWLYKNLTVSPDDPRILDPQVYLWVRQGRVTDVSW